MAARNDGQRLRGLGALPLLLICSLGAGCIGVSQKRNAGNGVVGGTVADLNVCRAGIRVAEDGAIDDFEDGNNQINLESGRDGYWYSAKDDKGSTVEIASTEGGAGGSEMAMHIDGKTLNVTDAWGASLGALFKGKGAYDASKYAGVVFKVRAGKESTRTVRFNIGDINTHKDGNICRTCWNHFGKTLSLTPEWKEYRILFTDTRQEDGWGDPRPQAITPSKLYSLEFKVGPGQTFDLWLDDFAFLACK